MLRDPITQLAVRMQASRNILCSCSIVDITCSNMAPRVCTYSVIYREKLYVHYMKFTKSRFFGVK